MDSPEDILSEIAGIITNPAIYELARSSADFIEAENALRGAKGFSPRLTPKQAECLLAYIVHPARELVLDQKMEMSEEPDRNQAIREMTARDFSGQCEPALGFVKAQAKAFGLELRYHQINDTSPYSTERHVVAVVDLPVVRDGSVSTVQYLLDPTFVQFFSPGKRWAQNMCETEEGQRLARRLIRQGFAELTEETARIYLGAQMREGAADIEQDIQAFLHGSNREPPENSAEAFREWVDFSLPSKRYANIPRAQDR